MTKRKLISLLLALTLVFALASCRDSGDQESGSPDPSQSGAPTESADPSGEPTESDEPSEDPTESAEPSEDPTESAAPSEDPAESADPSEEPSSEPSESVNVDLQAFYEELLTKYESSEFGPTMLIEGEFLTTFYPALEDVALKQQVIYQPMQSAVACEIALVEVENAADVQTVKDSFQERIDVQVGTDDEPGAAWYPETIEGWKNNSRIVSNGNYVMLIVWNDCDQIVEDFNALF